MNNVSFICLEIIIRLGRNILVLSYQLFNVLSFFERSMSLPSFITLGLDVEQIFISNTPSLVSTLFPLNSSCLSKFPLEG